MTQDVDKNRRRFISAMTAAVTGLELPILGSMRTILDRFGVPSREGLDALRGATSWLNSEPIMPSRLRDKVVLIDIWTYTCINWLRWLPYIRAWLEKYRSNGLVVIGVHTPEFGFEHDLDNVSRAVKRLGLTHPIAVDNDYAIWRGVNNQYWPALYLFDGKGKLRHHQFGEGRYEQSEAAIQRVLSDSGARGITPEVVAVKGRGVEAPADWDNLRTPETYLGHARAERFASERAVPNARVAYSAPERLLSNEWALDGTWTVGAEAVALGEPSGRIVCRFHARDLHLVMRPDEPGKSVRFRIRLDGGPPGDARGGDIDEQGGGLVSEPRLYQLIRQPGSIMERVLEIEFLDPAVEAYALTFG